MLSYQRDGPNTYGENDKSSRKSIRFRKAWVNRTLRRDVHQTLEPGGDPNATDERLAQVRRKSWTKKPDLPLGMLEQKAERRARSTGSTPPELSPAQLEALRRGRDGPRGR